MKYWLGVIGWAVLTVGLVYGAMAALIWLTVVVQ